MLDLTNCRRQKYLGIKILGNLGNCHWKNSSAFKDYGYVNAYYEPLHSTSLLDPIQVPVSEFRDKIRVKDIFSKSIICRMYLRTA